MNINIKAGESPDVWKDKLAKLRQNDQVARWPMKFSKANVDKEAGV